VKILMRILEGEAMSVKPIPDGYHAVTPYLVIKGASQAIEFYKNVFGAVEVFRMADPTTNKVGHGPQAFGGTPVSMLLYVDDVDRTFQKAIAAGAQALKPVEDQFYGDRSGTLSDPFGHMWTIATHKEDVSPEEMKRRASEKFSNT
jgi:PhnB protein